jgi:uncharacterized protein YfaS (alpha-2-macroglobulin family)
MGYSSDLAPESAFFARTINRVQSFFGGVQTAQVYSASSWGKTATMYERKLRPSHSESHDDRVFLFIDELSPGVYEYEYYLRALVPGEFQHLPAHAEQLYFPEIFGRTSGGSFTVTAD